MTDKELRGLSRAELLEMMLELSKENEKLKAEAEELRNQLNEREIKLERAGSIAEASLALNGVFEAAQAAAAQYLENIEQCEARCRETQMKAEEQADEILAASKLAAKKIVGEAEYKARVLTEDARTRSESYWAAVQQRIEGLYTDFRGLKEFLNIDPQISYEG